eukprot:gene19748-25680_t
MSSGDDCEALVGGLQVYCASVKAKSNSIIEKGIEETKALTYNESIKTVENSNKFQEFVDVVTSKGFFDGASPDSIEYYQRYVKVIQKFNTRVNNTDLSKAEKEKQAEEKKVLGNTAFSSKDYHAAIQYYTEALDLSNDGPNSHIYYCNRAAAYSYLNEHAEAVADSEAAVSLDPTYVKVYSRLGLSSFYLNDFEKSVKAYEKAVELEPDNETAKKGLKQAKKKLDDKRKVSTSAPSSAGIPDVSSMLNDPNIANNPFMKDAMGKLGGEQGIANLMKDPNMMAMAQKMMQDPAALQQAMSMLGGKGGMPDMSSLMGGLGGAGAGKGKKSGFKGFEDDN